MISANHPQRILAAQPFITDHDILKYIVKRMADMERSGHVGWRIDNREGLRVGAFRTEQYLAFPMRIQVSLTGGGQEGLCLSEIGRAVCREREWEAWKVRGGAQGEKK